ncbi:MAG: hypothetical protein R6U98_17625, partial [Pirellulaceae bacterium]
PLESGDEDARDWMRAKVEILLSELPDPATGPVEAASVWLAARRASRIPRGIRGSIPLSGKDDTTCERRQPVT